MNMPNADKYRNHNPNNGRPVTRDKSDDQHVVTQLQSAGHEDDQIGGGGALIIAVGLALLAALFSQ
jgi:hypothetical protein